MRTYIIVMKSLTGKILLIVVIVLSMGTLLHFPYVNAEPFSFSIKDNSNTGGGGAVTGPSGLSNVSSGSNGAVTGPSGLSNVSSGSNGAVTGPSGLSNVSSGSNGAVTGPSGLSNASSNTGVIGPPPLSNANEALNNIYKTIIKQQQEHIQFLMNQQQALKDLLINNSSSFSR